MKHPNSDPREFGLLEPVTPEEEVIAAICDNDALKAASWLRGMTAAGPFLLYGLADMLDRDGSDDKDRLPPGSARIVLCPWGPGRRKKMPPPDVAASVDDKVVASLREPNAKAVAELFRHVDQIGAHALNALADMLAGDVSQRPDLKERYPLRLKIVTGATVGRPRRGDNRRLLAKPDRYRKSERKTAGWQYMMALRVKRALERGHKREDAIEEARQARPFESQSGRKRLPPSYEAVEKAYDSFFGGARRASKRNQPASAQK